MTTAELGLELARVDFEVCRNEDFRSVDLQLTDEDDVPRDLTGIALRMQVRREATSANPPVLDLAIGSGIAVLSDTEGRLRIEISRDALQPGLYVHDLVEESGGLRTNLWAGYMNVIEEPTRW